MLHTVNALAAITRGQSRAELLTQHLGRSQESLSSGEHSEPHTSGCYCTATASQ